ncbi:amino acid adenylation domain-containing protein [Kitasatospora sp. NPDC052896]|uniref:amino acid adenylation domain-containing protein n=1 Tax=Kitasatospora sp. NPDC052896 TaxID=3364061 RepID=UPI0037C57335
MNGSERPFRRPVSATEWLYLAAHRLGSAMTLQLVVEGEGSPEPDALRAAVAAAAEACPGSRLVRRGRVWVDSGRPPRVRVAPPGTEPDFGAGALAARLDLGREPGCEVLLLPQTAGRPTALVFRAFHGVMDGHGARLWMGEVFRALRGEPARAVRSPLTDDRLLVELGAAGRRRPTPLLDQRSPLSAGGPAGGRPRADVVALWRRRTLPGRQPWLTARLAQAVADAAGTARAPRARVLVPVDLRRHRPEVAATGNLTLPVFLDLTAGEPWRRANARLLRALAEQRELAGGFESALARLPLPVATALLRAGRAAAVRRDRHLASAIVSHLGRIDPADCSGGGFTARSVHALPVHAPLVPVSCVAIELPDRTELVVGCQGPGPVAELSARADRLLDRLAGVTPGVAPRPATTPVGADGAATVVGLFRRQAALRPTAPALDGPEGPVSYRELDRRSDAVAAELLRRGIAREAVVGLLVDRGTAGVAMLWGILKAGAGYLPLDPRHPAARISETLRESGAAALLTERQFAGRLDATPCPVLLGEDVPATPPGLALPDPAPEQLAYVIHTSGSTGRPKGVQIEHRSLLAFVRWAAGLCQVNDRTRFAFLSSYAFDISCFPLFLPLLAGGTTVLVPGEPNRPALHALLARHRADTLAVTPAHLDLVEHFDLDLSGLRTLLVGGERFTLAAAERARARLAPDCRIVNAYGPTEASVACLAHVLDGTERGPSVPIGHPGPAARVELDESADPVPGIGEILVSGVQLARGYLGRPELDAERFQVGADGVRRYRTGDLGRRLPCGAIEFVGRTDEQLKIAGHRIEPAEVRTALEAQPEVLRAAVTVRARPGGGPALCGYVVTGPDATTSGPALRDRLAARLPGHLVPAVIVPVAELPTTVGGKTDFAALPDPFATPRPVAVARPTGGDVEQPTGGDTVTERVAVLWARTLGVDRRTVDGRSDFQQLGGDSLAVLEMLAAVAGELLGPADTDRLMAEIGDSLAELTLDRVAGAVRRARREGRVRA